MPYKTISVDVDVEVDIGEFEDEELIEELRSRGYNIAEDQSDTKIDKYDIEFLLNLIDRSEQTWYIRCVRDKLFNMRVK
jgi:hypothetical protein